MRKHIRQYLLIAVLVSIICIGFPMITSVAAETLYVDDAGGEDHYSTIQEAINAANESDIIEVYSGTYYENIVINKTLTLSGAGAETTFITGVSSGDNTTTILANDVYLSGFTIDNNAGSTNNYDCIRMPYVNNCTITETVLENGNFGIYLLGSNHNQIRDNVFQDNYIGMRLSNSDSNKILKNTITNNNQGIYATQSTLNEIGENDIVNNIIGINIALNSMNNVLSKNDFDNNGENAKDSCSNSWSKNGRGNYWDDYNDYDNNSDGIGDNPYEIANGDNVDAFPLGDFLTVDPVAHIDSISPNPATDGENIDFYGHGTSSENIVDWEWRSNKDGLLNQGSADFSSSSLSVGTHSISFRVKDDDEQWSEYDTENLVINSASSSENQVPIATIVTISPSETVEGESIYMHGYGTDTDGMIVGYSWHSDEDGMLSAESSFSVSSLSVGTHSISFKVKDNDGDWSQADTATIMITQNTSMNQNPVAIINGPYTKKINTPIIFDASTSYDPDTEDTLSSYEWDFGDGKTGSGEIITHSYNQSGNYTVTLTVKDNRDGQTTASSFALVTNQSSNSDDNDADESDTNSTKDKDIFPEVPAFELVFLILGIMVMLFYTKLFRKK